METNLNNLLKTGANITVAINLQDLQKWHSEVIQETKKELEKIVIDEKAETYPTAKQVSTMLNVNLSTLWRWHKNGYLKHIEFGGGRRYLLSEVKALMSKNK